MGPCVDDPIVRWRVDVVSFERLSKCAANRHDMLSDIPAGRRERRGLPGL